MPLSRAPVPSVALRLADDSAGDPCRRGCTSATCYCVNYDRCSSIAENGVIVGAEGYVRRDYRNVRGAICADNQRKIRDIASWGAVVVVFSAAWIKVRACGFKVGWVTRRNLMNVNGMLTRRKILDVQSDFDAFWRARKLCCSHALTIGILEFHCYRLGSGAAVRLLGLGGSEGEKQTHPA